MFTNQTFNYRNRRRKFTLYVICQKNHQNNGNVVCTGLGVTPFHKKSFRKKQKVFLINLTMILKMLVKKLLGENVLTFPLDITLPESLEALTDFLK